ncbi:MAG: ATP-dependent Clp protease ATP-binding subunit [Patescibacteria group bacterium]
MPDLTIKLKEITFTEEQERGGRGAWFLGRFLHWGANLKKSLILLDRGKQKIDRLLMFLTWLIIFGGWAAFVYWLFLNQSIWTAAPIKLLFFWRAPDPLILVFLLSLWFDLFLIYKNSEAKMAAKKINYRLFEQAENERSRRRAAKRDGRIKKSGGKKFNVAAAYSRSARQAVEDAYLLALKLRQSETAIIHLFRVLLKNKEIQNLFIRLNVDAKRLVEMVDRRLAKPQDESGAGRGELAPALEEVLVLAFADAYNLRQNSVDVLNIISFCCEKDPILEEILYELEIDKDKIKNTAVWFRVNRRLVERYHEYRRSALLKPGGNMNRAYTAVATPTLDHFSHDLTVKAKYGASDICVGRDKEINAIFEALSGGHNGVLLVGPTGVGKSAIVEGLAQLMVEENVPEFLKDKRLVELDVSRLISGADPGQAEERLLSSLNEVRHSGNIILYLDNIENLIGISAGSQESLDLSEVLAEAIGRKNLYCIAAATTENYARYIERRAIGEAMTTIGVKEPEENEAIQMLETKVGFLEGKYDIYIVYEALEAAVRMSSRYLRDKALPLKALNLLEKAASLVAKKAKDNPEESFCGREAVALAISELTGIPANQATASEKEKLLNLENEIHKRLVDQVEAVEAVSAALRRARAEMKDVKRPIASFLFLGPTGVGKTELAKSVSEIYFGNEEYLIRLDMSEYQLADSVKKMIGDVDGTLGYLTEAVRKKPFSLILFDEIEKAHPDVLNLFLQLLDDGRLTDGQGRTISFTESIIIATSNIGAVFIQDQIRAQTSLSIIKQELIDNHLNKYLRPELINRFDGIIVFKPLSEEDVFAITTLMLKKMKRNLSDKGIDLKADKDGVAILAQEGYDPKFGARPLRRLLQDKIENIIADKILTGELKRRDTVLINNRAAVEIEKGREL